jgi:hypothetical protein
MEEETQEAAENYEKIHGGSYSIGVGKAFKFGAEWQAERMYSEEEVKTLIDIINWYDNNSDVRPNFEIPEIKKGIALIDWFIDFEEQFKKK